MKARSFQSAVLHTPIGFLEIRAENDAVTVISFHDEDSDIMPLHPENPFLEKVATQIEAYFSGERLTFDFPLSPTGTEFQQRVWKELLRISFGATASYLEMAIRLGDEKCIRAAASANGRNPIGLVIPCHRVIGADGKLVGYAGGLWRKKWLLQHEAAHTAPAPGKLF